MNRQLREKRIAADVMQIKSEAYADGVTDGMERGREVVVRDIYHDLSFWQIFTVGFFVGSVATQMYRIASVVARFCLGWL